MGYPSNYSIDTFTVNDADFTNTEVYYDIDGAETISILDKSGSAPYTNKQITFKRSDIIDILGSSSFVDGIISISITGKNLYSTSSAISSSFNVRVDSVSVNGLTSLFTRILSVDNIAQLSTLNTSSASNSDAISSTAVFNHETDLSLSNELLYYYGYILAPGSVHSDLGTINPYRNYTSTSNLLPPNSVDYSNLSCFTFSPQYSQMPSGTLSYRSLVIQYDTGALTYNYFRLIFEETNLYSCAEDDSSDYGYKSSKTSGTYNFGTNMLLYGKASGTNWLDLGQGTAETTNMQVGLSAGSGMALDLDQSSGSTYYRLFKMLNVSGKMYIAMLLRENSEIYIKNIRCFAYQNYSDLVANSNYTEI